MKLQKLFGFLGIVAVAAAMTTACAQTDAGISTSVKSRLAADDTVKANRIDVDTKDKVVTLRGDVDTPAARERAVEVARATSGVREVVDVLKVAPAAAAVPHASVVGSIPEAGSGAQSLDGNAAGIQLVSLGGRNQLVQSAPRLRFVAFTGDAPPVIAEASRRFR
mgnify:CR=1 FL=1